MSKKIFLVLPFLLVLQPMFAANVDWNAASGEWKDASNWNPQEVPNAEDDDTARVNNGGVVTVTENASARVVLVGSDGGLTTNELVINSGVTLTTIGANSTLGSGGQFGKATVGGIWTLTGRILYVATSGTGTLDLLSGGSISASQVALGNNAGGSGTANIAGEITTTTSSVVVGSAGEGTLTLFSTGSIDSIGGTVGNSGSGEANISGLWDYTGANFVLGQSNGSTGIVTIENGGEVRGTAANAVNLGSNSGAYGEITVKNGGKLTAAGATIGIGNSGEGKLTIEAGGQVSTAGANLGYGTNSLDPTDAKGTVSVSGTWTNTGTLNVGARSGGVAGTGTLTVETGGILNSGVAYIGGSNNGGGIGIVTVKSGGLWESTNHILVGQSGTGTLTVESGATVKSLVGRLGVYAGGSGTADISGIWEIGGLIPGSSNNLTVGESGMGELTVGNGGEISSYSATLGSVSGAFGSVTIQNGGSLQTSNNLLVGNGGSGSLLVENGGTVVTSGLGSIGYGTDGFGTATVRGTWTISGNSLEVGRNGTGVLSIGAGGLVTINNGEGSVRLAQSNDDAVGVLNIGGAVVDGTPEAAEGAGTLNASTVTGRNTATVTPLLNFNHTETDYAFENSSGQGIVITTNVKVNVYSGTTSLTAASTYTAGTEVHAGTLLVNNSSGSGTGSGGVLVHEGATLGGAGTLSGAATVDGILSPGNSIGTLAINNNVTWNFNDAWVWELGTAGVDMTNYGISDFLSIGGDFTKGTGGLFVFDFSDTGEEGWYRLVGWNGASGFSESDFLVSNLGSGLSGSFVIDSGALYLNVGVIPEPSTLGLAALSLVGLLCAIRRRSR